MQKLHGERCRMQIVGWGSGAHSSVCGNKGAHCLQYGINFDKVRFADQVLHDFLGLSVLSWRNMGWG